MDRFLGWRVLEQLSHAILIVLHLSERYLFPGYDIRDVTLKDFQLNLCRLWILTSCDVTQMTLVIHAHTFRSTIRTVLKQSPEVFSSLPLDFSLEYHQGLVGICVDFSTYLIADAA